MAAAIDNGRNITSLFGRYTITQVIAEYFNKKPLFVPGAIDKPQELLDLEGFYAALPDTENVRAIFRSMHRASIAPNDARDMFEAGATICVTGIDLAVPAIRKLADAVKLELGYLGILSVNAYCSPQGSGLSEHYDPRIVTAIQLAGTKEWTYSLEPFELNPLRVSYNDDTRAALLRQHNARVGTHTVTLSVGDILCLPAGTVHEARAESTSLSLNLAFDYAGKGMADIFTDWLRRELLNTREFREPCFAKGSYDQEARMKELIARAEEVLGQLHVNPLKLLSDAADG